MPTESKILPRNLTAQSVGRVTGNPATTLLESGVGNCFPGLEMDIRNLERRFFPFLVVDLIGTTARLVEVDIVLARRSDEISADQLATYETLARDTADPSLPFWLMRSIEGSFGPFGERLVDLDALGQPGLPADAWTAVRLIPEGSDLTLQLSLGRDAGARTATLTGRRQAYLDDSGALSLVFAPGEMTQSLCSPWTHDFRDCGCFYWASNHPDIAQIEKPAGAPPDVATDRMVPWQRSVKGSLANPPAPARADRRGEEMFYYEINNRWQELAVVLDGREQGGAYAASALEADPFPDLQAVVGQLRYAAGVELGVMVEYLTAAYSLRTDTTGAIADDIRAANAELIRVAIGEMRHLRAVNDILREMSRLGLADPYEPALGIAAVLPAGGGTSRPVVSRPLTPAALADFIDIERPSFSVDGLYGRILATLRRDLPGPLADTVALIIAEGNEHYETFTYIEEWLGQHDEADYLIPVRQPAADDPRHRALQDRYAALLDTLHRAYAAGLPGGAGLIAQARTDMLADSGIVGACRDLAAAELLVTFETPADPRFSPVARP